MFPLLREGVILCVSVCVLESLISQLIKMNMTGNITFDSFFLLPEGYVLSEP